MRLWVFSSKYPFVPLLLSARFYPVIYIIHQVLRVRGSLFDKNGEYFSNDDDLLEKNERAQGGEVSQEPSRLLQKDCTQPGPWY